MSNLTPFAALTAADTHSMQLEDCDEDVEVVLD